MVLTGRADGPPLGAPAALIDLVGRASAILNVDRPVRRPDADVVDDPVLPDGLALLGERAALAGLTRRGGISCGGSTHLVPARDGFMAVSLARPEDVAALPAWLGRDRPVEGDPWPAVYEALAARCCAELDERAGLLGLPFAALGSVQPADQGGFDLPIEAARLGPDTDRSELARARVLDLSSLWAGPLCGQLLAASGADVIKVESASRPDGARRGPGAFFDLLNGAKRSVVLDLATPTGQLDLRRLIRASDVVLESARPRALTQMGIEAADELARPGGPRVWASITSHGRQPGPAQRVGFGDVAAAAGGLVVYDPAGPCFLADAVADPLAGLVTAAAVRAALAAGGHWLLSAALAPLAAAVAGPPLKVAGLPAAPPRARPAPRPAPTSGSDTAAVLAALPS
jgi:CoA-transferase family III